MSPQFEVLLWGALTLLVLAQLSSSRDICDSTPESSGVTSYLCDTPYCTCNDPYGRVYCSCKPRLPGAPLATEVTIRTSGSCRVNSETNDLIIADCSNVTFPSKQLESLLHLRSVQLINVREVSIAPRAFHWNATATSSLKVSMTNVTVADLPSFAFSGHISNIIFKGAYLGLVHAFAFSSITDTQRIQFVDCNFANIEPQAFKKFSTQEFLIDNSQLYVVPSRFVTDVHVSHLFRIHNSFLEAVRTLAFDVSRPIDTAITESRFNMLEGEAFKVASHGRVTIRDNVFETVEAGAFKGINRVHKGSSDVLPDLLFDNNTLGTVDEAALSFDTLSFNVRLQRVQIDEMCSCDSLIYWKDIVYPLKKGDKGPVEPHLTEIWCHLDSTKEMNLDYVSGDSFYQEHCTKLISSIYFLVIVVLCTAAALGGLIIVSICIIRRRQRYDAVPSGEVKGVTPQNKTDKGLVVPDGRVYRETEFHVIVEKVEPMDEVTPYRVKRDRSKTMFIREAPS